MGLATDSANNIYATAVQDQYSGTDLLLPNGTIYHSVGAEQKAAIFIIKLRYDGYNLPVMCLLGEYSNNGECVSCGPNTVTASTGSQSISDCKCRAGYFGTNGACTICPIGTYCLLASTTSTSCGANTYTATNGSTTQSQCLCKAGYFGSNGGCTVCPPGSYCSAGIAD